MIPLDPSQPVHAVTTNMSSVLTLGPLRKDWTGQYDCVLISNRVNTTSRVTVYGQSCHEDTLGFNTLLISGITHQHNLAVGLHSCNSWFSKV